MVDKTEIVNLALQSFGSRTTVTAAELLANSTNEAIQANLTYDNTRDSLLRMAPWDCAFFAGNLVYISSLPGTPENTSPATTLWQPGQPAPPWAYEYQYPADCLRACYITPQTQTGFAGGIPITTAVTGGVVSYQGPPVRFKVAIDRFFSATSAAVVNGGSGYAVGDTITLPYGPTTSPPIGAPAVLGVESVAAGVILTVGVQSQVRGSNPFVSGSYFAKQANPIAQDTTPGSGTGATFNLTYGASQGDQRIILTNQEFALLNYVRAVSNEAVWDPLFQDAMQNALGADICMALSGDKALANMCIQRANVSIMEARKVDGNEGLTINDVTPDWIRARGVCWTDGYVSGPYSGFDWGGLLGTW